MLSVFVDLTVALIIDVFDLGLVFALSAMVLFGVVHHLAYHRQQSVGSDLRMRDGLLFDSGEISPAVDVQSGKCFIRRFFSSLALVMQSSKRRSTGLIIDG